MLHGTGWHEVFECPAVRCTGAIPTSQSPPELPISTAPLNSQIDANTIACFTAGDRPRIRVGSAA